jgi:small subunit ribosomal protein S17
MEEKKRKVKRCVVVSDQMNKSRVGEMVRTIKHPVFEKYIKRTSRVMFHDEQNSTRVGDEVLITECAPMSARKSFKLVSLVERKED